MKELATSLAFSPDGAFLASGHVDGQIHLWSLDMGDQVTVRVRHDASIGQLAFSPDGTTLASCALDSTVKLWNLDLLRQGDAQRQLIRQPSGVTTLLYSEDGAQLIAGNTKAVLRVHDSKTGRLTATLRGHSAPLTTCILAPDGAQIASGSRDGIIRIFDLNRQEEVQTLTAHKKAIAGLAYFPGGTELASVAMDNSLLIWDLMAGNPRQNALRPIGGDVHRGRGHERRASSHCGARGRARARLGAGVIGAIAACAIQGDSRALEARSAARSSRSAARSSRSASSARPWRL